METRQRIKTSKVERVRCDIISIFPEYLEPLSLSLPGQAQRKGLLDVAVHDLRDFTHDRHRTVDDAPYGGGAGMVMKAQPWWEALEHVRTLASGAPTLIVPGPGGEVLTQSVARELSQEEWLIFACGRYEGIDERVYEAAAEVMPVRVVSLGDYVLNGGEVAVLAIIEAAARLLPGFMGNSQSLIEESHEDGLLEYPVYTKPANWRGLEVPSVLLSGDHGKVAQWRHQQRLERTAVRRPDLLHPSAAESASSSSVHLESFLPSAKGELLTLGAANGLSRRGEWLDPGAWRLWISRSGGRLVGSVRTRLNPQHDSQWDVADVMVVPDLQKQGLETGLLAAAESLAPPGIREFHLRMSQGLDAQAGWLRQAKYRRLALDADGAAMFHRRAGHLRDGK